MMQVGIFSGYFPYSLEETAKKIRALDFNTVQLDMHFKDIDLSVVRSPRTSASKSARHSAITICRFRAFPATPTSFTRTR